MLGDVVLNELAFANDLLSATFTVCEAKEDLSYDLRRSLDEIATVFRCRDATVLEDYPYMKILSSTVVHLQQLRPEFGRHLRLWLSNIAGGQNDDRF